MFKKTIIHGCEVRGDGRKPYLTRYTLFECKSFQICLHVFHRSDSEEHHDHPWNFTSIILWRGYYEETVLKYGDFKFTYLDNDFENNKVTVYQDITVQRKLVRPLSILRRKAEHRHRVILVDEKPAVTLVFMGKRVRTWGFFTKNGWMNFRSYFIKNKC